MKNMKKILLPLVAAATLLSGGCGKQFDAGNYVKALLDNSYKNDSTAFIEQEVGTKEQAEELYNEGIKNEVDAMLSQASVSESLSEEYTSLMKDIFKNVKYTIGESKKQDNGSYEVEVTYEKMNIFAPAVETYMTNLNTYTEEIAAATEDAGEIPSEEEINEKIFVLLKDALKQSLDNVTYEPEASITMHVELNGNMYSVNENDLKDMEMALFDIDAFNEALSQ